MSIGTQQQYIRIAKYAMYLPNENRRETWEEQIQRVFDMHRTYFFDRDYGLSPEEARQVKLYIEEAEQAMLHHVAIGSQRVLQFGGKWVRQHNAKAYNCSFSYVNRPRFFQEAMYMLLCGSGVGFSVQKHHVAQLPPIAAPTKETKTFVIPDSIEGWADSIGILLSSYFIDDQTFPEYAGHEVLFDYSEIRPEGSPLSSGHKAPGPDGLRLAHQLIKDRLDKVAATHPNGGLAPIDAYDIILFASDAVISGGVRRSASLALFSPDDEEMLNAKIGRWQIENPQRARANNSVLLLRDKTSYKAFHRILQLNREFGEPGFIWSWSTEIGVNPCAEISFYAWLETNSGKLEAGWAGCNLSEVNGALCTTAEAFYRAVRAAAIMGTLQAAYTSFPYLGKTSEDIFKRESLLGISITGMMDNPRILFDPMIQQEGVRVARRINETLAKLLHIPTAARLTCVKPSGTASLMLGTASGIHPHHAKRYFRRVQANFQEPPVRLFESINPRAVEDSVWDRNGKTKVITFLHTVPWGARTKNKTSALELLELVRSTQQNWVVAGTNPDRCAHPQVTNNVSNTIHVRPDEWEDVANYIYDNREFFTGVSLIPHSGDKDYPQAPFCTVPEGRDILEEYGDGSLFASGLITHALDVFDGNLWDACDTLLGIGKEIMEFEGVNIEHMERAAGDYYSLFYRSVHAECKCRDAHESESLEYDDTDCECPAGLSPGDISQNIEHVYSLEPGAMERFLESDLYTNAAELEPQREWLERATVYAMKYFDGSLKRMCYCLKDVHNLKLWDDLERENKDIDWSTMVEEENNTDHQGEAACAGGACELPEWYLEKLKKQTGD